MRAVEAAVKRMLSHLNIEKVDKEWGQAAHDLHKKIEDMSKGSEMNGRRPTRTFIM
jgi:hypothetical protein